MQKSVELNRAGEAAGTLLDQNSIKLANRKVILDLLLQERILTKQEISERTGFSFPTVSNSIGSLLQQGLVREAGTADSTGGRKPKLIEFNPNSRFAFGVTIQGQGIRVVRSNIDMQIVDDVEVPIRRGASAAALVETICTSVSDMICRSGTSIQSFLGIGVAVSGYVNRKTIMIEAASNLGLKNVSLASLADRTGLAVYIENEANAAALAEQRLGIAQGMSNLIYISITEGVGSGMIIDGRLYMGAHNRAGELGHHTVVPGGRSCSCGKRGCWERYVAEDVLLNEYRSVTGNGGVGLKEFFADLSEQRPQAAVLWERYISYLVTGLHNIVAIYDPHYVVIGGNIAEYPQHLLPALMKGVFGASSYSQREDTYILVSELNKDAFILGAAFLPMGTLHARLG